MRGNGVTWLVVVIFLTLALAGCVGGESGSFGKRSSTKKLAAAPLKAWDLKDPVLSQPIFKTIKEKFPFRASDGTNLDIWMWRPVAPEGEKFPVIMHISPYYASSLPAANSGFIKILNDNFTARGYVVMGVSVRGTGFSDGCFEIGGPRERQDYVELTNKIAEQPWSNGWIGITGVSYDGTAPQSVLITGAPHVKTIVPIAAISEWYKYDFINGVQINPQGWAFNSYYVALEQAPPNVHPTATSDPTLLASDVLTYGTRACTSQGSSNSGFRGPSVVDVQRAQVVTGPTGMTDPYWEERNYTRYLDHVRPNVSVFTVHGLVDYNVKMHNELPWFQELQSHNVTTKILLGHWQHAYPGTIKPSGRSDWNLTLLRWFDYWLKGIDTGIMNEPMADMQDFSGIWHHEDNFPPTRAHPVTFYFDQTGTLKESPGTGQSTFLDDGQPFDQTRPTLPSATSFLGPKLENEFRYIGEGHVHLELTHSLPKGQVAVTIYNVTNGRWQSVNWGFFNYNIRNAPDKYDPVVPNQRFTLDIPLIPTDMVIPAGSQIGVVFSGINSGNDGEPQYGTPGMLPLPSGGLTTLFHGAKSSITFPAVDGITPICPQPKMLGRDPVKGVC